MLDNGVGISLINHVPEELLFASLTGVQVSVLCRHLPMIISLCCVVRLILSTPVLLNNSIPTFNTYR